MAFGTRVVKEESGLVEIQFIKFICFYISLLKVNKSKYCWVYTEEKVRNFIKYIRVQREI